MSHDSRIPAPDELGVELEQALLARRRRRWWRLHPAILALVVGAALAVPAGATWIDWARLVEGETIPDAPLMPALGTGAKQPISLHGQVSSEVARLVIAGPGGTYDVPRSRHGMLLILYSAKAEGTTTLTAHLRDGSTRFKSFEPPPDTAPPGAVEAPDPGGLPDWTVAADVRTWGARKGQTCAQFVQRIDAQAAPGRSGGESGAPLCGDLRSDPLIADATAYGPRSGRHPFGPGPGPLSG